MVPKTLEINAIDQDRFWSKVDKTDYCWNWTGTLSGDGYGRFYGNGKPLYVHRITAGLFGVELSETLVIDHLCRNRACCNPDHLEAVTAKENTLCGFGITAEAARKTHCDNGHPLAGENLYNHDGKRYCRKCRSAQSDAYRIRIGWIPERCKSSSAKSGNRCKRRTADDSGRCYSHRNESALLGEGE